MCGVNGIMSCVLTAMPFSVTNSSTWTTDSKKMEALKLHKCQLPSIDHIRFRPWEEGLDCEHVEAFAVCCEGEGGGEFSQEIREHWQRS